MDKKTAVCTGESFEVTNIFSPPGVEINVPAVPVLIITQSESEEIEKKIDIIIIEKIANFLNL